MRYIQTAVSSEDHKEFTNFAFNYRPQLTLGKLMETAVKLFIALEGKEDAEEVKQITDTCFKALKN